MLVVTTGAGCASAAASPPASIPDRSGAATAATAATSATLAIGASVTLPDGVVARLADVTGDSRCPDDANCVWAGDATVTVVLTPPRGAPETIALHTGVAGQESAVAAGWRVTLERLDPAPSATRPVERPHYRAALAFSQ